MRRIVRSSPAHKRKWGPLGFSAPIRLTPKDTLTGPARNGKWYLDEFRIPLVLGSCIGWHGPECRGILVMRNDRGEYACARCAFKGTIPKGVVTYGDLRKRYARESGAAPPLQKPAEQERLRFAARALICEDDEREDDERGLRWLVQRTPRFSRRERRR